MSPLMLCYVCLVHHVPRHHSSLIIHTYFCAHISPSLAQDTTFSCVVTALFLRPIFKILGELGDVHSEGQISLEKTKWLTLLGAGLAVLSSTAMYINAALYVMLGGLGKPFYANPYLHPLVFGFNLDSVLNDLGMLLACGVIKKITCEAAIVRFTTAAPYKVEPAPQPQPAGAYADPSVVFGSQEGDKALPIHSNVSSVAVSSVAQDY